MLLKIDGTINIWKQTVFWTLNRWGIHNQSTRGHYHWSLCAEKMTIHQSVENRAVIRNHYSFVMNFNANNQTCALVNKNTPFPNTRTPDLIKLFKLVKITFENASISCAGKRWKRKMIQMLHRLRVFKIFSTKKKTTFGLFRFDRRLFINISVKKWNLQRAFLWRVPYLLTGKL